MNPPQISRGNNPCTCGCTLNRLVLSCNKFYATRWVCVQCAAHRGFGRLRQPYGDQQHPKLVEPVAHNPLQHSN